MYMCPGTLSAARRSAGAVITAVDHVMSGRNRNAFCVVRPPGHHIGVNGMKQAPTTTTKGCGLSVFNNVAIGALHALDRCERVAIIDIDAHHGDGTEDVVRYVRTRGNKKGRSTSCPSLTLHWPFACLQELPSEQPPAVLLHPFTRQGRPFISSRRYHRHPD